MICTDAMVFVNVFASSWRRINSRSCHLPTESSVWLCWRRRWGFLTLRED